MSDASAAPATATVQAHQIAAGDVVMKRRRPHRVVGSIGTSSANWSVNTRPVDEPDAELDLWVGPRDTQFTKVLG